LAGRRHHKQSQVRELGEIEVSDKFVVEGDAYPLREVCGPITQFDASVSSLLDELIDTMTHHHVLSLSAPQIGRTVRVAVINLGQEIVELINPTLVQSTGQQTGVESCASFPDMVLEVERPACITLTVQDRRGTPYKIEASGILARLIQHELDHLDGVLFYDQLDEEDLFLQVLDQLTGEDSVTAQDVSHPLAQDLSSALETALHKEKSQILDMIADAAWKLLLAVELLQDIPQVEATPAMTELKALTEQLRVAADDWESILMESN
jgi:peptide deformylase